MGSGRLQPPGERVRADRMSSHAPQGGIPGAGCSRLRSVDPHVGAGKACIRGLRFPVSRLLGVLAAGETRDSILTSYSYLAPEDIDAALRYAAALAEDETVELSR